MSLLEKLFKPKPEPEPKTENVLPGQIGYDSTELRELIIRWVENEGWKLSTPEQLGQGQLLLYLRGVQGGTGSDNAPVWRRLRFLFGDLDYQR